MRREIFKKHFYTFLLFILILFGILLRLKGFLINPSFWHDECGLAWNIKFKTYSELFGVLRFLQVAPPFFTILTKFLTGIFGFSETVFRAIPCLASCLSIAVFYLLAKKVLNNKFSVLCAVALFVINTLLIRYSFEFKPYETDVLLTILCLLFFINFDIEKSNKKKALAYGFMLALLPWFSFVSAFIIAGGLLNLIFKNIKQNGKEKILILLPIIFSSLVYLKFYVFTNYTGTHMVSDWQYYFVTLNPVHFMSLFVESLKFLFSFVYYILFIFLLFVWGIIIYIKEKSLFLKISVLSFAVFILASFLHIYPFGERLILFLIPIYLLFVVKPIDLASFDKKIKSALLILTILITFYPQFFWANYFLFKAKNVTKGEYAREMTAFLAKNKKDTDLIFVNDSSNLEYAYYSSFYDIKNKVIQVPHKGNNTEMLDTIKKGSYCWIYLAFGQPKSVLDWVDKNAAVIKMLHAKQSNSYFLIYIYIK